MNLRVYSLGVWQHKGWLAVLDRGLASKVEESSSGSVFFKRQNFQIARYDASSFHLPRAHCEKIALSKLFFFFLAALRSLQDLSSLTRDQTRSPSSGSMES